MAVPIIKDKRGVTLIELVIVISMIGMVIALSFLLFSFGNINFSMGRSKYEVQSSARLAVDKIIQEVRFATRLEIVADIQAGSTPLAGFNYLYIANNGKLYHVKYNTETHTHNTVAYVGTLNSGESLFERSNLTTLKITIGSTYSGQSFMGTTNIKLPNLSSTNGIVGTSGSGLVYTTN